MSEIKVIAELEEIMDLEEGTLKLDSVLEDFEEWDSMSRLSVVAFAKQHYHIVLSSEKIKDFVTVKDICDFLNS